MDPQQISQTTRGKMHKGLDVIRQDLATVRTGRAAPSLVENIMVSAYDGTAKMKLQELATITTTDNRTLVVAPFDTTQTAAIEKAILEANVGLTPIVDGGMIRLTIPSLTEERRQEYAKLAKSKIESGRIMIRQIRHDVMAEIKRAYEADTLNEDAKAHLEDEIQRITDETMAEIDVFWEKKEQELMQV